MDKDLMKKFESIRFSDLVESNSYVYRDDSRRFCEEEVGSCNTSPYSSSDGGDNESNSDSNVKDRYSPEDISFWVNFGYFRNKNKE